MGLYDNMSMEPADPYQGAPFAPGYVPPPQGLASLAPPPEQMMSQPPPPEALTGQTSAAPAMMSQAPEPVMSYERASPAPAVPPAVPPMMPRSPAPASPQPMQARGPSAASYRKAEEAAAGAQAASFDDRKKAQADSAQASFDAGRDIAAEQRVASATHQVWAADDQLQAAKRQTEVGDFMKEIEAAQAERAKMKTDPGRLMRDKGAAGAAFGAIGAIFGGIAASLNGGHNPYMEIVNRAIDRDIDAQHDEMLSADKGIAGKQNRLGILRQQYGDADVAKMALRNETLEGVKASIASIAAKTEGTQAKAKAADAIAELTGQQEQLKSNIAGHVATRLEQRDAQAAAAGAARLKAMLEARKTLAEANHLDAESDKLRGETGKANPAAVAAEKDERERYSPFQGGILFNSAKSRETFEERAGSALAGAKLMRRALELKERIGKLRLAGNFKADEEVQELEGLSRELRSMKLNEISGSGIVRELNKPDIDAMNAELLNPMVAPNVIRRTLANADRGIAAFAEAKGHTQASAEQRQKYGGTTAIYPEGQVGFVPNQTQPKGRE